MNLVLLLTKLQWRPVCGCKGGQKRGDAFGKVIPWAFQSWEMLPQCFSTYKVQEMHRDVGLNKPSQTCQAWGPEPSGYTDKRPVRLNSSQKEDASLG